MFTLNEVQCKAVGGGNLSELVSNMANMSFYTTAIGGLGSAAFAWWTDTQVLIPLTASATNAVLTGSELSYIAATVYMGVTASWAVGAALGLGVYLFNHSRSK